MPGERAATVLRGRSEDCRALDRLLDGARAGQSSALVIRGEALSIGRAAPPAPASSPRSKTKRETTSPCLII
jgi:hypothetical protein